MQTHSEGYKAGSGTQQQIVYRLVDVASPIAISLRPLAWVVFLMISDSTRH